MILPENEIAPDDYNPDDASDQQSQQDIHSNGLDDERTAENKEETANTDLLEQSFKAAEPSYTLNVDDKKPKTKKKREDKKLL